MGIFSLNYIKNSVKRAPFYGLPPPFVPYSILTNPAPLLYLTPSASSGQAKNRPAQKRCFFVKNRVDTIFLPNYLPLVSKSNFSFINEIRIFNDTHISFSSRLSPKICVCHQRGNSYFANSGRIIS